MNGRFEDVDFVMVSETKLMKGDNFLNTDLPGLVSAMCLRDNQSGKESFFCHLVILPFTIVSYLFCLFFVCLLFGYFYFISETLPPNIWVYYSLASKPSIREHSSLVYHFISLPLIALEVSLPEYSG